MPPIARWFSYASYCEVVLCYILLRGGCLHGGVSCQPIFLSVFFVGPFSSWWWRIYPIICAMVELLDPSSIASCSLHGSVFSQPVFLHGGGGDCRPLICVWWSFSTPHLCGGGASRPFLCTMVELNGSTSLLKSFI